MKPITLRISRFNSPCPSHIISSTRQLHCTPASLTRVEKKPGADPSYYQGHAVSPEHQAKESMLAEHVRSGLEAQYSGHVGGPMDAAAPQTMKKAPRDRGESGNQEGVGFVEQVGGQSAFAQRMQSRSEGDIGEGEGMGPVEDPTPPSIFPGLKKLAGASLSAEDVKQNRGGGGGVTGTGTFNSKSTSKPGVGGKRQMSTLNTSSEGRNKEVPGRKAGASERQHVLYRANADAATWMTDSSDVRNAVGHEERILQWQMQKHSNCEFPTGPYRNSGVPGEENSDYEHVSKEEPYDLPAADGNVRLRYGGLRRKVNSILEDEFKASSGD
ncbi:hypothetical protein EVG20_g4526 [Dentipellis fragilis]|uniref:Uncharacterized protein n=1 Tax=Dentipellis fragilis TaxID=205917 RepID=A0A4Y9YWG1_9AGAM|nr:hypothetical protein EVG20_g4526 [Dentipellis fragilis]